MKKIVLLIICVLMLSGCTASSTFDISFNEKVKEKSKISENVSNIDTIDQGMDDYLSDTIDIYKDDLDNGKYKYKTTYDDTQAVGEFSTSYDNVCSAFINSIFTKQFFTELSCDVVEGYYEINGKVSYFICEDNCMELPVINSAVLNINLPQKAVSNNADEIEGNTYTWNFEEGQGEKVVELKFKQNKIVSIIKSNTKKDKKNIIIIIFGISILLLLLIFGLYSKYKKTKISL